MVTIKAGQGVWNLCCGLSLLALAASSMAAQVDTVKVRQDGARYAVSVGARIAVSARAAYRVVTDFSALPEINPDILLAQPRADHRLYTVVHVCVWFFCRKIKQLQTVETTPPTRLVMDVIAAHSDLRYGHAEWHFKPLGPAQCSLRFRAVIEPDFWVPPLIGPWLIRKALKKQALRTIRGIERVADKR